MSDNVNNCINADDEEISLLDLLVIVLKYRRLICFGTAIVTILAGLYLFALPRIKTTLHPESALAEKKVNVIYTITAHRHPQDWESQRWNDFDFSKVLFDAFNSKPEIAKVYKNYPFLGEDFSTDKRAYNNFINDLVNGKFFKLDIQENWIREYRNIFHLSVIVNENQLETLTKFVTEYVDLLSESLSESVLVKNEKFAFYTLGAEVFVCDAFSSSSSSSKKFVIIVFAALFM
nr:hypothetical protein [Treponema sp.]